MLEILIGLAAVVLILVVLGLKATNRQHGGLDKAQFTRRWREASALLGGGASGYKLAVIEADKILDTALKQKGYGGETMGERLKSAGNGLGERSQVNAVWDAHRLRNRLVHEESKLSKQQALRALNTYQATLKRLGAL